MVSFNPALSSSNRPVYSGPATNGRTIYLSLNETNLAAEFGAGLWAITTNYPCVAGLTAGTYVSGDGGELPPQPTVGENFIYDLNGASNVDGTLVLAEARTIVTDTLSVGQTLTAGSVTTANLNAGTLTGVINATGGNVLTNLAFTDPEWNSAAMTAPDIMLVQWASFGLDSLPRFTNFLAYACANNITFDTVGIMDQSCVTYTNSWGDGIGAMGVASPGEYPGGMTNLVAQAAHYGGVRILSSWGRYPSSPTIPNHYAWTPVTSIVSDFTAAYQAGVGGFAIDKTGVKPSVGDMIQYEESYVSILHDCLQQTTMMTNLNGNNQPYYLPQRNLLIWWPSFGRFDSAMNLANEFAIADLVICANGPRQAGIGWTTGPTAEARYVQWVTYATNLNYWVRPGHCLWGGVIDDTLPAVDTTNVFNLHAIFTASMGLSPQTFPLYTNTLASSPPALQALANAGLKSVWRDPAMKMAKLSAILATNSGGTTELWVKPLNVLNTYAFILWNHSGSVTSTVAFKPTQISPSLANSLVTVSDPWTQTDLIATNSAALVKASVAPLQVKLFTIRASPAPNSDGSSLTNLAATQLTGLVPTSVLPGITTNLSMSGVTFHITNGLIMRISAP